MCHVGRPRSAVPDRECYLTFNLMRKIVIFYLGLFWMSGLGLAQEQAGPSIRILPKDVVQDSIRQLQMTTNKFTVRWTYTEAGAKRMLLFWKAHDGHEVITRVGSFERRCHVVPRKSYVPGSGWTDDDEAWLKMRIDKFVGLSEDEAKTVTAGLKSK